MKKEKSKYILCLIFLFVTLLGSALIYALQNKTAYKPNRMTIVIDAGHGGRDGGSVGKNGTIEKEVNLRYANEIKNKLQQAGFNVILTRENDAGLYDLFAKNKKLSDMNRRMQIIKKANPNLVISIHMNSFTDSSVRGYQVFYKLDDEPSKNVAKLVSDMISNDCGLKNRSAKSGDFYILNCSYYTSILIECGYLSNIQDEQLINSNDYLQKFSEAVCKAVEIYFGELKPA